MHRYLWTLPTAALLAAGCGGAPDADHGSDAITVTNDSTVAPIGPAPAETGGQSFVATVLGSYDFVQASSRLAGERGGQAETKAFATSVSAAIEASRRRLEAAATGFEGKAEAGATSQGDLAILGSTRGTPFDQVFVEQQVEALTQLVGLIRAYKNGGDNPALKAWAEADQAVVNDLLLDAQTLSATLQEAGDR